MCQAAEVIRFNLFNLYPGVKLLIYSDRRFLLQLLIRNFEIRIIQY
jgi:hypothetical protein